MELSLGSSYLNSTALYSFGQSDISLLFKHFNVNDLASLTYAFKNLSLAANDSEVQKYQIESIILLIIPPILLILGTFGNILSFIILTRQAMRKYSTFLYLAILSISDTFVIYTGLLRLWMKELINYDITTYSDWICKLTNVLLYTVSDYSVWLLVAVTVERYVAVCHPLKAHSICRKRRATYVIISLLLILLVLNLHFLWTVEVSADSQCDNAPNYVTLIEQIWPWVDAWVYSLLPSLALLIFNILIVRSVIKARKLQTDMTSYKYYADNRRPGGVAEGSTRMTFMLLSISFAFLICTFPMNVTIIANHFYKHNTNMEVRYKFQLIRSVTELLMYMNHCMNFYLYCATGLKFRQQLFKLFRIKQKKKKDQQLPLKSEKTGASKVNSSFRNRSKLNNTSFIEVKKGNCAQV